MKNSHIVLFSLLFANSFILPANPAPDKKQEEKGTFDKCLDSPGDFGKCALVGTAVGVGVGGALWYSGGLSAPFIGKISSSISGVFESKKPAPKLSKEAKPAAAPQKVEAPKQLEAPKKEENNPPKKDEDDLTWKKVRNAAVLSGVGAAVGVPAIRIMGHVCDRVEESLPSNKKQKAEQEQQRIDQIKREAAESAVQKFMHCQDREQNAKLQFRIGNLDAKLDAMFVCKEE